MRPEYYDVTKTVWKAAKAIGVFGSGAGATIVLPDADAPLAQWIVFGLLCLPPLWDGFNNWRKHRKNGANA